MAMWDGRFKKVIDEKTNDFNSSTICCVCVSEKNSTTESAIISPNPSIVRISSFVAEIILSSVIKCSESNFEAF